MGTTQLKYPTRKKMFDLKALFETVVETAKAATGDKPSHQSINGREYIRNHQRNCMEEVSYYETDQRMYADSVEVADLQSMCIWAKAAEAGGWQDGEIRVSRSKTSHALAPRRANKWQDREQCRKPFYDALLPAEGWLNFHQFVGWLDTLGEGLEDEEGIRTELNTLSAVSTDVSKVRMTGAVIVLQGETKREAKGGLRRKIKTQIPFGDPHHVCAVDFLVSCKVNQGQLLFKVDHMALDSALQAYLDWARAYADEHLPATWIMLVTP